MEKRSQRLTLGQWAAASAGMFAAIFLLHDAMPPGTLGLPGFVLSGLKGAAGAALGIFAYEGLRNLVGVPDGTTGKDKGGK